MSRSPSVRYGAQTPFVDKQYEVGVRADVKYAIAGVGAGEGGAVRYRDLALDVYEPVGDGRARRPALIKQRTNKDLLYSTGNSTQYPVKTPMGKESKQKSGYMYSGFTMLYIQEK